MRRLLLCLLLTLPAAAQMHVVQTAQGYFSGSQAVSFPSAPATGDALIALFGYYSNSAVTTAPSGWTLIQQQYGNGPGGTTGYVAYSHVVQAGEANSYTFTTGGYSGPLTMYDVTGSDLYHPINGFASNAQTPTAASVATPAVTPTVTGTLPIVVVRDEQSQATAITTSGCSFTPSSHPQYGIWTGYCSLLATSPFSATFTLNQADSQGLVAATILISPAGTTGHTPTAVLAQTTASSIVGLSVQFDGRGSSDPRYEALAYAWNFGDGSTGTGATPSHTYSTAGSYTASLTVTNTDGYSSAAATASIAIGNDCSSVSLGDYGAMNYFLPGGPGSAWHQDVTNAAVDPLSATILTTNASDLAGSYLHPDFGGNGQYGIPYTVVDSRTTGFSPIGFRSTDDESYPDESDLSYFPIPENWHIESQPPDDKGNGDNHAILFDKATCTAYESYHTEHSSGSLPRYTTATTAIWDLAGQQQRPYGLTSVDAAGLSVFMGLVRYDEIAAGVVNHAVRFTADKTKQNNNGGYFTPPASHASGILYGVNNIEGMRLRLKASYDISGFGPQAKIIATALKKYGMILADNGANMYFQGTPDPRWDDNDLNGLKGIRADSFEVVNGSLSTNYTPGSAPLYPNGPVMDAVYHPTGPAPTNSLTASATSITAGQPVTLSVGASPDASYSFIDKLGLVRGSAVVHPSTTTTYTATTGNAYGRSTSSVTVTVRSILPPILNNLLPLSN